MGGTDGRGVNRVAYEWKFWFRVGWVAVYPIKEKWDHGKKRRGKRGDVPFINRGVLATEVLKCDQLMDTREKKGDVGSNWGNKLLEHGVWLWGDPEAHSVRQDRGQRKAQVGDGEQDSCPEKTQSVGGRTDTDKKIPPFSSSWNKENVQHPKTLRGQEGGGKNKV